MGASSALLHVSQILRTTCNHFSQLRYWTAKQLNKKYTASRNLLVSISSYHVQSQILFQLLTRQRLAFVFSKQTRRIWAMRNYAGESEIYSYKISKLDSSKCKLCISKRRAIGKGCGVSVLCVCVFFLTFSLCIFLLSDSGYKIWTYLLYCFVYSSNTVLGDNYSHIAACQTLFSISVEKKYLFLFWQVFKDVLTRSQTRVTRIENLQS